MLPFTPSALLTYLDGQTPPLAPFARSTLHIFRFSLPPPWRFELVKFAKSAARPLCHSKIATKLAQHPLPPPLLARFVSLRVPLLSMSRQLSWAGLLNGLAGFTQRKPFFDFSKKEPSSRPAEWGIGKSEKLTI